jgi:hypothetical protein
LPRPATVIRPAIWFTACAAAFAAPAPPLGVSFHHIHVNDRVPQNLVTYYGKLFRSDTTRPAAIGRVQGIESDGVFLLIDAAPQMPPEHGAAGWHFGWGTVSVDEAYDRHRMQEIEWELPLERFSKDLHLHLESENPVQAAEWYRDRLGATLQVSSAAGDVQPVNPAHRRPLAIVRLDRIALAIYKTTGPLESSRGRRIDHIAFRADLAEARARTDLRVLAPAGRLGTFDTMMIEGPDQLAIELVGAPSFPGEYSPTCRVIQSSAGC